MTAAATDLAALHTAYRDALEHRDTMARIVANCYMQGEDPAFYVANLRRAQTDLIAAADAYGLTSVVAHLTEDLSRWTRG